MRLLVCSHFGSRESGSLAVSVVRMPPKRVKAAAKPKGKHKAAPKPKSPPKKGKAAVQPCRQATSQGPDSPAADEASRGHRKQLERRDTDQQLDRAMASRLEHVPKSILASKTTADGVSIRE